MGLDMYAYTVRQNLADPGPDVDVNLTDIGANAMGFSVLSEAECEALSDTDRGTYYEGRRVAFERAREAGLIDMEFAYWRKFNALHGWMNRLYDAKGGTSDFNCTTLRLREADLDQLEADALNMALTPMPGPFFGSGEDFSTEERDDVLAFVTKARAAIADGKAVFYDSWW